MKIQTQYLIILARQSWEKNSLTPDRGFGTSIELAKQGARVYIASRSASKVEETISAILKELPAADVSFLSLDLADLSSVRQAADTFLQYVANIRPLLLHVSCNNFDLQTRINASYTGQ